MCQKNIASSLPYKSDILFDKFEVIQHVLHVPWVATSIKWSWVMFLKKLWLNVKVYIVHLWRDTKALSVFVSMGITAVRLILSNMSNLLIFGSVRREHLPL